MSSPSASNAGAPIVDLFGVAAAQPTANQSVGGAKASDDLLQLGNPFADMFDAPAARATTTGAQLQPLNANNLWMHNNGRLFIFTFIFIFYYRKSIKTKQKT